MLQSCLFSCPIPLLPNLIFECLVDCAFCVLRPLLVVLGPEYLIPIQLDLDHLSTSSTHHLPRCPSLTQDLHGYGRYESGIRTVPLPGNLVCAAPRYCGCGLSYLVVINSGLYRLCGSLHGLDTF